MAADRECPAGEERGGGDGAALQCRDVHDRPEIGIRKVTVDGEEVGVTEEVVASHLFAGCSHFRKEETPRRADGPRRGAAFGSFLQRLLRGTVATLLPDHNVDITHWVNARNIPLLYGRFDLYDFVDVVSRFVRLLGPNIHVVAMSNLRSRCWRRCRCWRRRVTLRAGLDDPMGGPIDPRANPTEVNRFAMAHPLEWFDRTVIATVPARYPGPFGGSIPALQLAGFLSMNFDRHVSAHWSMFHNLVKGDGDSAAATRAFYKEYSSVMDLPADFYLQTIKRVFHDHDLPLGRFRVHGDPVEPQAIERTALMTVEGENDDICAVGQTVAAHDLCTGIPPAKKTHHLQLKVGHYGVFHGRRWQTETYPKVKAFIRAQG